MAKHTAKGAAGLSVARNRLTKSGSGKVIASPTGSGEPVFNAPLPPARLVIGPYDQERDDKSFELVVEKVQACGRGLRLTDRAVDVIGDRQEALRWLLTPVAALGFQTPIDLAATPEGEKSVLAVLDQLEHGVYQLRVAAAYRLCSARYTANSGVGAALHGGRWNRAGTQAIYCAESRSLAALEILVHYSVMPRALREFAMRRIEFDDDLVSGGGPMIPGWEGDLSLTQGIGAIWHDEFRSAVLRVPSSVEPHEYNYVLNPDHPEFPRISFGIPVPYRFDPRPVVGR